MTCENYINAYLIELLLDVLLICVHSQINSILRNDCHVNLKLEIGDVVLYLRRTQLMVLFMNVLLNCFFKLRL